MATDIRTVRLAAQSSALFKLHGSTNWFAPDGEQLMVMGGNKPSLIQRYPVLQWFGRQFSGMLSQPGARLTVIGYGFGDFHINQTMVEAWQKSQFPMLILHPQGKDVLRMVNRTYGKPLLSRSIGRDDDVRINTIAE